LLDFTTLRPALPATKNERIEKRKEAKRLSQMVSTDSYRAAMVLYQAGEKVVRQSHQDEQ
jgi:hypothetical protein